MIIIKSPAEIESMSQSGRILASVLEELKLLVQPGIRTRDLDLYAERRVRELGGVPSFKGYRGYPASLCVSVNEEVIHGIPSGRVLQEGDIVSLDFGVLYEGFHSDAALTVPVGKVNGRALKLIAAAEAAFLAGLSRLVKGARLSDVSYAIEETVRREGFSVIRQFVGHGIGRTLHEEPQVPNFGPPGRGPRIEPGLTVAIEPMIAAGGWEVEVMEDGWTAVTKDRSLSAHYEHTVAVTEDGTRILTALDGGGRLLERLNREKERSYA
jgi:methionyl aminopeptidase